MFISLVPRKFPEHTHTMGGKKPTKKMRQGGMIRESTKMWVYQDRVQTISCWTTSFWGRVIFLFTGKLWLQSIGHQPTVGLSLGKMFETRSNYAKAKTPPVQGDKK